MANVAKYTKAGAGHLCKHYDRAKDDKGEYLKFGNQDIDTSRTSLNYNLAPDQDQMDFINKRCGEVKCLQRKDVNVMCSWVVTKPKDITLQEEKKFFQETYNFLENRYGQKNVISANVHMDETTPHLHFAFVPVVLDKKKGIEKVSAKEAVTMSDLKSFHQDLDNHLHKAFGREIGILNESTKQGNKSIEFLKRTDAVEKFNQIKEKMQETTLEFSELKKDIIPLRNEKNTLEGQIEALKKLQGAVVPVKEKKSLFSNKVTEVTMSKSVYDACVAAQLEYQHQKSRADEAEEVIKRISKSASLKENQMLVGKIKDLTKENENLTKSNDGMTKEIARVNKIFSKKPKIHQEFLDAEKEIKQEKHKSTGYER